MGDMAGSVHVGTTTAGAAVAADGIDTVGAVRGGGGGTATTGASTATGDAAVGA
jgi:hypothetical protein